MTKDEMAVFRDELEEKSGMSFDAALKRFLRIMTEKLVHYNATRHVGKWAPPPHSEFIVDDNPRYLRYLPFRPMENYVEVSLGHPYGFIDRLTGNILNQTFRHRSRNGLMNLEIRPLSTPHGNIFFDEPDLLCSPLKMTPFRGNEQDYRELFKRGPKSPKGRVWYMSFGAAGIRTVTTEVQAESADEARALMTAALEGIPTRK